MTAIVMALRDKGLTETHLFVFLVFAIPTWAWLRYLRGIWPFGARP